MRGVFNLTEDPMDYWEVKAGCVIRHHRRPRRALFQTQGLHGHSGRSRAAGWTSDYGALESRWQFLRSSATRSFDNKIIDKEWTGCTIFQITGKARREMGMFCKTFLQRKLGREGQKPKMARQQKECRQGLVSTSDIFVLPTVPSSKKPNGRKLESFFHNQVLGVSTRWTTPQAERNTHGQGTHKVVKESRWVTKGKRPGSLCGVTKTMMLCQRAWTPVHQQPQGLPENFLLSLTAILGLEMHGPQT